MFKTSEPGGPHSLNGNLPSSASERQNVSPSRDSKTRTHFDTTGNDSVGIESIRKAVEAKDTARLFEVIGNFEKGELAEVWHLLEELSANRSLTQHLKVGAILRASTWSDPAELIRFITDSTGPGLDRNEMVESVFHTSHSPMDELLALAGSIADDREREAAFHGISSHIGSRGSLSDVAQSFGGDHSAEALGALTKGFVSYVVKHATFGVDGDISLRIAESVRTADQLVTAGQVPEWFLKDVALGLAKEAPNEAWREFSSSHPYLTNDKEFATTVARSIMRSDPMAALEFAAGNKATSIEVVSEAIFRSAELDYSSTERWIAETRGDLTRDQMDAAVFGIARHQASVNDFGDAWEWQSQIQDEEQKKRIEGEIWQAELKSVRESARQDPEKTIDSIVSGESQHTDYWLEEVMRQWIVKDSGAAAAWYEEAGRKLPDGQSQYIAAAYVREALAQNNLELAREWVGLIKNEKTRARIDAEIAKASGNPQ